jgi:AraC-like DNA-binding protein
MGPDFSVFPLERRSTRYSSRKFPLHALTVLSGHSRETADYYNDGKTKAVSSYAVWQYTVSGRGRIGVEEPGGTIRGRDLLPGSLMIVSVPGPQVYYLPEDSDHWEFVFLVMIGREAIRITRMIERQIGNAVDTRKYPKTLAFLHEILGKIFNHGMNDPFINSSYTYRLCMLFLEEAQADRIGDRGEEGDKKIVAAVKDFLKSSLHRDITVEDMAARVSLSRSHFTRLFSRETGMSPRNYLEDLRLRAALDILFEEGSTIKETAARCGIFDVNYFCRLFRKRYGVSPGEYKERNSRTK